MANLVVLAATLAAIIWYSIETRRLRIETAELRRQAVRQTSLQIRPFLALQYVDGEYVFRVTNIGKGVARDVAIADLPLPRAKNEARSTITWDVIDFIASGDAKVPVSHLWIQTESEEAVEYPVGEGDAAWMARFSRRNRHEHEVEVGYYDLARAAYVARFRVGRGVARLLSDWEA